MRECKIELSVAPYEGIDIEQIRNYICDKLQLDADIVDGMPFLVMDFKVHETNEVKGKEISTMGGRGAGLGKAGRTQVAAKQTIGTDAVLMQMENSAIKKVNELKKSC